MSNPILGTADPDSLEAFAFNKGQLDMFFKKAFEQSNSW